MKGVFFINNKEKLKELRQQLFDCNLNYRLLSPENKKKLLTQYEDEKRKIRREMATCMMNESNDEDDKLKELRQHLFDCNLNYHLLSPENKEKLSTQYEDEKRKIRREMAVCMMNERNDEDDKYKRR